MSSQPNVNRNQPLPQVRTAYYTDISRRFWKQYFSKPDLVSILKTFDETADLTTEAYQFLYPYMQQLIAQVIYYSTHMALKRGQQSFDPEDIEYAIGLISEQYIESLKRNQRNQSSQISQSESQNVFTEPINESQQEHQNNLEMLSEFRKSKIEEMIAKSRSKFGNK